MQHCSESFETPETAAAAAMCLTGRVPLCRLNLNATGCQGRAEIVAWGLTAKAGFPHMGYANSMSAQASLWSEDHYNLNHAQNVPHNVVLTESVAI